MRKCSCDDDDMNFLTNQTIRSPDRIECKYSDNNINVPWNFIIRNLILIIAIRITQNSLNMWFQHKTTKTALIQWHKEAVLCGSSAGSTPAERVEGLMSAHKGARWSIHLLQTSSMLIHSYSYTFHRFDVFYNLFANYSMECFTSYK